MKIKRVLTLSPKEQDIITDFGNLVNEICDEMERERCETDCIFKDFCNISSIKFLQLVRKWSGTHLPSDVD